MVAHGKFNFLSFWEKFGTLVILLGLLFVFGSLSPRFLTPSNLVQITVQSSIFMILGMAELVAILTAGIDLSVGSILALTGATTTYLMSQGWSIWQAVSVGTIFLGAFLGFLNGTTIALSGLPPFIVTLGTMNIFRGLTLVLTGGRPIYQYPYEFNLLFGGYLYGYIPSPVFTVAVVGVLLFIFLRYTTAGRSIYAIGGNVRASWLLGIRVRLNLVIAYTLSGLLSSIAGLLMVARVGAAEPLAGLGYELFGIASTIIGGTSFFGGIGNVPNTIVGALVIGTLNNALNMIGVQTYFQQVVSGFVIIVTVLANKILIRRE